MAIMKPSTEGSLLDKLPRFARFNRLLSIIPLFTEYNDKGEKEPQKIEDADIYSANVVTSEYLGDKHLPLIDIDMDAALVPSSTSGHYHLYIDKPMSFENMMKLLEVMQEVGIVQKGYVDGTRERGYAALRLPHIKKEILYHSGGLIKPVDQGVNHVGIYFDEYGNATITGPISVQPVDKAPEEW